MLAMFIIFFAVITNHNILRLWIAWRDKYFIQIVSRKEFLAVSSSQKKRGANNSESFEVDFIKSFIVPANCTFSSHGLLWIVKI